MSYRLTVDFDNAVGAVKPFHGINNAPIIGTNTSLYHYLGEAGIPYSRLHDTGGAYGGFRYVDIENIFRDFNADVNDPDSYDFAFTDWLLEQICAQGTKPFYRLGATIENAHYIKAYRIFPPKDNLKWAKICEGIINHYNHGWANGYHYNIQYWEIWNEPDNEPQIYDNPMWKGTKEEYFSLYETTANYLKEKFPYIKIGGYASCGFYALKKSYIAGANSSPRTDYFVDFFHDFLGHISSDEHKAPLDFFSWHSYDSVDNNIVYTRYVREQLDKYGFNDTEIILNEWNPGVKRRGTEEDACYILEMLLRLHGEPLDMLNYYDGQVNGSYQGLFNPLKMNIFPAYFALHSFNELYSLKNTVSCIADDNNFSVLAASDGNIGKILISNTSERQLLAEIECKNTWHLTKYRVLQGTDGLIEQPFEDDKVIKIPPQKIVMLEYNK